MNIDRFLIILPLVFPEGIAPGAGSGYNRIHLARNGLGEPILRGTSLAGVLRHGLVQWRLRQMLLLQTRQILHKRSAHRRLQ